MNKYLEKIAGFNGQSTEHLRKRITQLESAIEKASPNTPSTISKLVPGRLASAHGRSYDARRELHNRWVMDKLSKGK